jgi:hypothetical protein
MRNYFNGLLWKQFADVVFLSVGCRSNTNDKIIQLTARLKSLGCQAAIGNDIWYIHAKPLNDLNWKEIVELCHDAPRLCITVEGPVIDDKALSRLESLENVTGLLLYSDQYSDAAMVHIRHLKKLELLILGGSPITDKGLVEVAGLPCLQSLDLRRTKITDGALKQLERCVSLKVLLLADTATTDNGIGYCRGLRNLVDLDLCGTKITDKCIPYLSELKSLRQLNIGTTAVTDAGGEELSKILTLCKITKENSSKRRTETGTQGSRNGDAASFGKPWGPKRGVVKGTGAYIGEYGRLWKD